MRTDNSQSADYDRAQAVKLFKQAQQGCQTSLNQLMAQHEGLVQANVRRQWPGQASFEERVQAGRIGLWRAILGYDPQRGLAFSTYAWPSISRAIWRVVQASEPQPPVGLPLVETETDPAEWWAAQAVYQELHQLVRRLPERQRLVILAYYGLNQSEPKLLREIGASLGLSIERVRQLHLEALIWLRHPGHSHRLRTLLNRHRPADYEWAQRQAQAWRQYLRRCGHGR